MPIKLDIKPIVDAKFLYDMMQIETKRREKNKKKKAPNRLESYNTHTEEKIFCIREKPTTTTRRKSNRTMCVCTSRLIYSVSTSIKICFR